MSNNVVWHHHADNLSVPEGMNLLLDYLHERGILKAGYQRVKDEAAG